MIICIHSQERKPPEAAKETQYRVELADDAGLLKESEKAEVLEAMRGVAEYCHVGFYTTHDAGDWERRPGTGDSPGSAIRIIPCSASI